MALTPSSSHSEPCRGCPWWLCCSPPSLIKEDKERRVLKCSILNIINFLQEKYYLITHWGNLSNSSISVWFHKHGKYFISLRITFVEIDQLGPHCVGGGHSFILGCWCYKQRCPEQLLWALSYRNIAWHQSDLRGSLLAKLKQNEMQFDFRNATKFFYSSKK